MSTGHAILTAIGSDRPGLVDEVSQFIFEHGGNLADSRMVNLRGQFAMMVLFDSPPEAIDRLRADLSRLGAQTGLRVELHPPAERGSAPAGAAMAYRLTATALDQSGLVHRIAHALRQRGVNIESMDTRLAAAPYTGAPMFEMDLVITIPAATAVHTLREQLGKLCDELNVDWEMEKC
jgi:glycine cleavage system transcriptional repressor